MKKHTVRQEILLLTTTTFSKRLWCENDVCEGGAHLSGSERLEKACWDGLLEEMLPGIIKKSTSGKKLYLWHVRHGEFLLQIELCEFPLLMEKRFSIDPILFMPTLFYN